MKDKKLMEQKMKFLFTNGKLICKKMTNSYGEWKGFEIPKELLIN
jgi:hypothetical protein